MSKKYLLSLPLLLTLALVACSKPSQETQTSQSAKEVQTEKTEKRQSKWQVLEESTITYPSDADIEAVQTIGDVKQLFKTLSEAYAADFSGLIQQVPAEAQEILKPFEEQVNTMLSEQQDMLEQQFANLSDDEPVAAEGREQLFVMLKSIRDQYAKAMDMAYEQMDLALASEK